MEELERRIEGDMTLEALKDMLIWEADRNRITFTESEDFLFNIFAPYTYGGRDLSEYKTNPHMFFEMIIKPYDIVVRLDQSIIAGDFLGQLSWEKAEELNPIIEELSKDHDIRPINHRDYRDTMETLTAIKITGLDIIRILTKDIPYEILRRETRVEDVKKHINVVEKLKSIHGDVPFYGFGSGFINENGTEPNDWDTRVVSNKKLLDIYREIEEQKYMVDGLPLEFGVIPQDYFIPFHLGDVSMISQPGNSIMLNGSMDVVTPEINYLNELRIHKIINHNINLRYALTKPGLDACENIERRVMSYLKRLKFATRDFNRVFGTDLKEPEVESPISLEDRHWVMFYLNHANVQFYKFMRQNSGLILDKYQISKAQK